MNTVLASRARSPSLHLLSWCSWVPAFAGMTILIRAGLPRIAQRRRDRVDRELDPLGDPGIALPGAVALEQFDLEQVQRLDIGQAQADRFVERRIALEQIGLAGHGEQAVVGPLPFVADP